MRVHECPPTFDRAVMLPEDQLDLAPHHERILIDVIGEALYSLVHFFGVLQRIGVVDRLSREGRNPNLGPSKNLKALPDDVDLPNEILEEVVQFLVSFDPILEQDLLELLLPKPFMFERVEKPLQNLVDDRRDDARPKKQADERDGG